jgi:hypothetical protein
MSYTVESQNRLQDGLDDDDDAAVVAKLPQMGVLVDLLPRQAGVAREESVAVAVSGGQAGVSILPSSRTGRDRTDV